MNSNNNERIYWIDAIKAICIFAVMLTHGGFSQSWLRVDYFFLVGFFFCSGYTFNMERGLKYRVVRIIDSLIIPYLFFSLLMYFPYYNHIIQMLHDPKNALSQRLINVLYGYTEWFIPTLISIELIYAVGKKFSLTDWMVIGGIVLFFSGMLSGSHLPWHIDTALYSLLFFHIGYQTRKIDFNAICCKKELTVLGWIVVGIFIFSGNQLFPLYPFNTSLNDFSMESITMAMNLLGVVVVIFVSCKIKPNKYITYLGTNSLLLFYLHSPFVYYGHLVINQFFQIQNTIMDNSLTGIIYIFAITILLYPLVQFTKRFEFISGKGRFFEKVVYKR